VITEERIYVVSAPGFGLFKRGTRTDKVSATSRGQAKHRFQKRYPNNVKDFRTIKAVLSKED